MFSCAVDFAGTWCPDYDDCFYNQLEGGGTHFTNCQDGGGGLDCPFHLYIDCSEFD
jgi:hypothetical protein